MNDEHMYLHKEMEFIISVKYPGPTQTIFVRQFPAERNANLSYKGRTMCAKYTNKSNGIAIMSIKVISCSVYS